MALLLSGALTVFSTPVAGALRASGAQRSDGARPGELQLFVEVDQIQYRTNESPSFKISFLNDGQDDLLLNGGELLGNGAQVWSAIRCELVAEDGRTHQLSMGWGVAGVAGRLYFLGVPLRPGSSYTISVRPRDYYYSNTNEPLTAGNYGLTCTYTGVQSRFRDATQLPPSWEGQVTSNTAPVAVGELNR